MRTQQGLLGLSAARAAWTVALSAVFVPLAFWGASLDELWTAMQRTQWGWIAVAAMLYVLTVMLKAARWRALFAHAVSYRVLLGALTIGQAVNFFVPARIGDVARVVVLRHRSNAGLALTVGTVVAEKIVDLLALAVLCVLVFPTAVAPGWLVDPWARLVFVAAGATVALVMVYWQRDRLKSAGQSLAVVLGWGAIPRAYEQIEVALGGIAAVKNQGVWAAVVPLTAVISALMVATNVAVFRALQMPDSWTAATLLLIVLQIGVAVPSTPGKIGVFQALVQLTLSVFGSDREVSLGYGLLLYLVIVVSQIVMAGPFLWQELASLRTGSVQATSP